MKNRVIQCKNSVRYKIFHNIGYQKGIGKTGSGKVLYLYKGKDYILFSLLDYSLNADKKFKRTTERVVLKLRNGKFNLIHFTPQGSRNISTHPNMIHSLIIKACGSRTSRLIVSAQQQDTLDGWDSTHADIRKPTKVVELCIKRINVILNKFLKEQGIKFKFKEPASFSKELLELIFPALRELPFKGINVPSGLAPYFREPTIKSTITKCFGGGPKITKLVCQLIEKEKELGLFYIGASCRKLIPIDYLQKLLEERLSPPSPTTIIDRIRGIGGRDNLRAFRRLLRHYNVERRFILMQSYNSGIFNARFLKDTLDMYVNYADQLVLPEKPKNFNELHDNFSVQTRKLKVADRPIPVIKALKDVEAHDLQGLRLVTPKSTHELVEWSELMNNCIASYAERAVQGQEILLGVVRENKLLYNISVRNGRLMQFYGKFNQQPEAADKKIVLNFLVEKGIIQDFVSNFDPGLEFPI